ncbi:hypothetical protein BKA56DRAFT_624374 [Ilyonectria sp. MPI-CAGE-AT-0026]|nr:hypothetical protein BKA56DRAFT_624374 [Ilyonectria sp. MPI-CAGE-AT-0026]
MNVWEVRQLSRQSQVAAAIASSTIETKFLDVKGFPINAQPHAATDLNLSGGLHWRLEEFRAFLQCQGKYQAACLLDPCEGEYEMVTAFVSQTLSEAISPHIGAFEMRFMRFKAVKHLSDGGQPQLCAIDDVVEYAKMAKT